MLPTLFHIGPIPIRSFGVMVLLGFLLGLWYAMAMARRRICTRSSGLLVMAGHKPGEPGVITPDHIFDLSLIGLFVSIVCARLLYVLLDLGEFRHNPWEVFKIWTGGISIHGAMVGGALTVWWYCRRHKLLFLAFADLCSPAFALGYAVGRIGCFLNGCCYGHACDLPWAVRFHAEDQHGLLTPPSHPTQLYATLMSLAIFALLHRYLRRPHRDGAIFLGYLALYCVYRFIDEYFRRYGPGTGYATGTADIFFWGLTHAQVFSLLALPVILFFLWRILSHTTAEPPATRETVSS
jgi:phosphatidylglycerol:prolipoprotein diacylglycerol transferase